uniref:Uncharacterized protein n=1 Tax=Glossina austeni TaxID=7395 RepID=A0A1A9UZR7_GLOAU
MCFTHHFSNFETNDMPGTEQKFYGPILSIKIVNFCAQIDYVTRVVDIASTSGEWCCTHHSLDIVENDENCHVKPQKLVAYQDWVNILRKLNNLFITNTEQLEWDVARRSDSFRRISTLGREKLTSELIKSRRHLHSLIKIIQKLLPNGERDPCDLAFKTMSRSQNISYRGAKYNTWSRQKS